MGFRIQQLFMSEEDAKKDKNRISKENSKWLIGLTIPFQAIVVLYCLPRGWKSILEGGASSVIGTLFSILVLYSIYKMRVLKKEIKKLREEVPY